MENMLAKHATSMSNRPNMLRNMLGRFARGLIQICKYFWMQQILFLNSCQKTY